MSRIAKMPVDLPKGVNATLAADSVTVKGAKGALTLPLADGVSVAQKDQTLVVAVAEGKATNERVAAAGATRANLANMVTGVTKGFERKLELVGVGYRAAVQGKNLNLTLGFSHPVAYPVPDGISIETPSADRDPDQGRGPPESRPGRRRDPRLPSAGALQGQGRALCRREDRDEGRQEEVSAMAQLTKKDRRLRRATRGRAKIRETGHGAPDGAPHAAAHLRPGHDGRTARRCWRPRRPCRKRSPRT